MVKAILAGAIMVFLFVYAFVAFMPALISSSDDLRSIAASESHSCTTSAGGVCSIDLDGETYKYNTEGMTVTETSPGAADRTAATTVSDDRTSISITGLTALTAYTFTVAYREVDPDLNSAYTSILNVSPPLVAVVVIGSILLGIGFVIWQRG